MEAIIAGIVSSIAGGAVVTFATLGAKKREANLNNDVKASGQWKELYERSEQDSSRKSEVIERLYKERVELLEKNGLLSNELSILTLKRCDVRGCDARVPQSHY